MFHLRLDDQQMREVIGIGGKDFHKVLNGDFNLTFEQVENLSNFASVNIESIVNGSIDYTTVKAKYFNKLYYIPERYLVGSGTHLSAMNCLLDYCAFKRGNEFRELLLRHLGLSESALLDGNRMVNLELVNDFGDFILNNGFEMNDLENMAKFTNLQTTRMNVIRKMFNRASCDYDVLKTMVDNQHVYEKNFDYSLKRENDRFMLIAHSKEEINDLLGKADICSGPMLDFKLRTITTTPIILNFDRPMKIIKAENYVERGRQVHKVVFQENNLCRYIRTRPASRPELSLL